ncbi:Uncharacterised protein [Klebsiella pneumoniae]|nr:Uncharacterised protein [Klebsiella pneumoniae]
MRGLPLQLGMLCQQQLANLAGPAVANRRIAGLIAEVDAGASRKQRLDIGFIIHFDRQHQRAEIVGGKLVHLCAALRQRRDHRGRPLPRRHLQRRESFTVRLIHFHPGGRQRQHQIGIIPRRRQHQRCGAGFIRQAGVRPGVGQRRDGFRRSRVIDSEEKGRFPGRVDGLHVRAVLEEQRHYLVDVLLKRAGRQL